jgi:hypothetical protein
MEVCTQRRRKSVGLKCRSSVEAASMTTAWMLVSAVAVVLKHSIVGIVELKVFRAQISFYWN